VPSADVADAVAKKSFSATTDFGELSRCDVINVCVPTPLTRSKDPDVSHMASAMEEIRKRLRSGQLIVLGSTTYPGTTHELFVPMLESTGLRVGHDFALAFAPERIDPANRQFAVREVPKVVGGETALCCELARQVFETIFDRVVPVSSTQSAEMVKLLENTFRAINIGLANEVAMMCDRLGLDVWEVIEAAATKPYGYMKFLPGRASAATASRRSDLSVVEDEVAELPGALHRPRHRDQRADARARRRPRRRSPERGPDRGERLADPDPRRGVQGERLRRARVAGARRDEAPAREGRRDRLPRSARARARARRRDRSRARTSPTTWSRART
jgi:hypothetical protein